MWRFKASKYKNAAPIVPKPEQCVRDIVVGSYQTFGNNIASSAAFMAFPWDHVGSSLAVLPIDDCGRKSKTMPLLHAHTDTVTDLEFSPFHDGLLATASQDCLVKIWSIPEKGLESSLTNPECTFSHKQRRVERVGFHPTADCLLYSTSAGNINLWDLVEQKEIFANNEHPEVIQAISWKADGTVCGTTCKDKTVRVVDPRASQAIVQSADSHQSIKDSRIVWLGAQNRVLTTGFDANRLRQVMIRDVRNFGVPEKTLELDCSTGILMPLFDPDTNMLFLAGKGDTTIGYLEITDKEPHLIEGIRHSGEQTKGASLVPKRALRVMEGEVNRVMQLTSNSVIPIMYQVPRKTYRDFHADLYPDTTGFRSELLPSQWMSGINLAVPKMTLDPAKRELGDQPIVVLRGNLKETIKNINNKLKKSVLAAVPTSTSDVVKPSFIPIKDKIKQMETNNRLEAEKMNEFNQIFREVTTQRKSPRIESIVEKQSPELLEDEAEKTDDEKCVSPENGNGGFHPEDDEEDVLTPIESLNGTSVPPKPLPRTSRTNSITESNSVEDMLAQTPRPQPKPRTTATYKPRLGPKPFTSGSATEFSFDKVFSVPQVPGVEATPVPEKPLSKPDLIPIVERPPYFDEPAPQIEEKPEEEEEIEEESPETTEKDEEKSPEEEEVEIRKRTPDEEVFKRPTTADIRKDSEEASTEIFEKTESEDTTDDKQNGGNFDRLANQRSSIAERRRIYENKSQSVAEEKPVSPLALKRRDSLKVRGEIKEEDTKRVSVPPEFLRKPSDLSKDDIVRRNSVKKDTVSATPSKRTSTVFGRVSKFRHLKGTPGHKSTQIENIRNISRQVPGECDGFQANFERVAVPLSGAGGKIAIFELSKTGKLPDGVIPSLVNGGNIMDFQWDPFNSRRLAVACDDGMVKLWSIPEGGLVQPTNEPLQEFVAHSDKIYSLRYHPVAKNVGLTASYDMTVKIWDFETLQEKICLRGHTDQIFSIAWSPCGKLIASVSKDSRIRVWNPRKSQDPISEGPGPVGTRGARICWAIEGEYLVVTGFDKVSERQISLYRVSDLATPLNTVGLDVAPAILMPFYDEDSSTLFVTGKGDSTIYAFEITEEAPFICPLSHHRCTSLHQGLSFLPKNQCDVTIVEFAKAYRLTNNAVEPLSFTVPRIKSELFQDDLFPPTRVTWLPTLTSAEWFTAKEKKVPRINLQPEGMESLSSTQHATNGNAQSKVARDPAANGIHPAANRLWSSDLAKSKEADIKNSVSARMEVNYKLEQDEMEGVDEEEWVE